MISHKTLDVTWCCCSWSCRQNWGQREWYQSDPMSRYLICTCMYLKANWIYKWQMDAPYVDGTNHQDQGNILVLSYISEPEMGTNSFLGNDRESERRTQYLRPEAFRAGSQNQWHLKIVYCKSLARRLRSAARECWSLIVVIRLGSCNIEHMKSLHIKYYPPPKKKKQNMSPKKEPFQ